MMNAEEGIHELSQYVDSLIVIPNERLLNIIEDTVSANEAFDKPNEVLYEATRGIADIITIPGRINVDFADVRAVMNESGEALMGCGSASGENRAVEAAQKAISSPLLEGINIEGAQNILLNVTGSSNLSMKEINEGNQIIYDAAGEEANVIFGWVNKEEMNEYVSYTVIATGFKNRGSQKRTSTQSQETNQKPQQKESGTFGGGYKIGQQFELDDTENLDIPTIYRVKGSKDKLRGRDVIPQSGFKTDEQLDAFREDSDPKNSDNSEEYDEENNNQSDNKKDKDRRDRGSDSSSFLRMMMD
jgi:cell division protein FtsZ